MENQPKKQYEKVSTVTIMGETETEIIGSVSYEVRYDKRSGAITCTCPAGKFGRSCHHLKEMEEILKDRDQKIIMKERFGELKEVF